MAKVEIHHTPAMVEEVMEALNLRPGGVYVDCTVGEGGHAEALLGRTHRSVRLLGIDLDDQALSTAKRRLQDYGTRAVLVKGSFAELSRLAQGHGFAPAAGVLFDFGLSSLQLETASRGFSFSREGPLDMRFDSGQELSATRPVNEWNEAELADTIRRYGQEPRARRIARAIVSARPIGSTSELARVVRSASGPRRRLDPATKTFQALRIAVNDELGNIEAGLEQARGLLAPEGRLVALSYHSLEDGAVKRYLRRESSDCICPPETPVCICGHKATLRLISRRARKPTDREVVGNPRSRSVRLRVAERLAPAPRV